jgi:multiple antibiotic resistance protein
MDSVVEFFLRGLVLVPVTLLPIINPLSTAPVFAATVGTNRDMATRRVFGWGREAAVRRALS